MPSNSDVFGEKTVRVCKTVFSVQKPEKQKKRSSQASWKNMLPGNSFPQICVVSVNKSVGNITMRQDYIGSVYQGNYPVMP